MARVRNSHSATLYPQGRCLDCAFTSQGESSTRDIRAHISANKSHRMVADIVSRYLYEWSER